MSIIGRLRDKWAAKRRRKTLPSIGQMQDGSPIIDTPWGPVSEGARLRAAMNMAEDHTLRRRVELLLSRQLFEGDVEKGEAESRRRYPEAYVEAE